MAIETRHDVRYGFGVRTRLPYDQAVTLTKEKLKDEGFGVLAEIDVQRTMKEKRGIDFRPYVILGVCNPPLAEKAFTAEIDIGLLLPCNVVVYATDDGGSIVEAMDPDVALGVVGDRPDLAPVATEAKQRLRRAIDAVAGA
ncbi:MAG: DUF302 domain-containing protein [Chloroflexota bacterium]|nr:DUF302 domain-containing protein [Chloroflexota bacterium]